LQKHASGIGKRENSAEMVLTPTLACSIKEESFAMICGGGGAFNE
jgi:hypothetical protein